MISENENSNNVLDKFFEYSIDLLCIADTNGKFVKLNPEWEKTLGYSIKELEGKPYLDFIHPDDLQATIEAGQELAFNKPIENFINRYRHKDGSYRWLEWRSFPHDGKVYASVRDITKIKKVEEELRLFKTSIDHSNDAVFWVTKNARFEYVNGQAIKSLGYSREELMKLSLFDIDLEMTKKKWDTFWESSQKYRSKGKITRQKESIYQKKNGHTFPVEISLIHFWKEGKEFHVAHVKDVTEQKQNNEALKISEKKYRSLFENMPYSFSIYRMLYDEKGNPIDYIFEEINPVSEKFTGLPAEKMLGKTVKELFPNTEDYWIQTFGKVAKTGIPTNFTNYSVELDKYFEAFVFSPGKDLCAIIFNDVTERKENEKKLNKFKASIAHSLDGVYWLNKGGGFDYVNEQACLMLGYKYEELIQLKINDIDPSFSLNEHKKNWNRLNKNRIQEGHRMESQHKKKDGSLIPVEVNAIFIWINDEGLLMTYVKDISERKEQEKILLQNQKLLSESQRVANIGSWENNIVNNTLVWNEGTYRIFGYEYQEIELTYKNFGKLIHPEDFSYVVSLLSKIIQTKQFIRHEYRIIRKDGEVRTVMAVGEVSLNSKGEVYRTYGILQDITERKKYEESLLKNQKLLNESQRIAKMGAWELNLDNNSIYWSDSIYRLFGLDKNKQEINRDFFLELVHPDDRESVNQSMERAVKLGKADYDDFRIIRSDGQILHMQAYAEVIRDNKGRPIKLVGVSQDISEKKAANAALKASEQITESLFRVAPVAIGIIKDRLLVEVNSEGSRISGYSKEELIGKSTRMLYKTEEEYLRVGKALYENLSSLGSSRVETVWKRKDGESVNIYIALTPIDIKDHSKGLVFAVLDITERKQYEEALEKRVLALTRPLGNIDSIEFTDLFNVQELQELQDSFSNATGVASLITYPDGTPITKPSNFCGLCNLIRSTKKGRKNCSASDAFIGKQSLNGPRIEPCISAGLWDAGASITLGDVHVANWLVGQVKNKNLNEEKILGYADVIGVEKEEFKKELGKVTEMSKEQFQAVADVLYLLANEISVKSYQNLQQARFIAEQKEYEKKIIEEKIRAEESEQRFKALHNASFGGIFIHDNGIIIDCNQGLSDMSGYSFDELIGMNGLLLVPEQCRDTIKSNMALGLEDAYEIIGERKNGEVYPLRIEARNIPYKGRKVRVVEFRDITEQKQAETELLKAKERAEESEFFLQESQRTGNIGSYKLSFKTGYWISTETLDRILGINDDYDKNIEGWLGLVHPDDSAKMNDYFNENVIGKQQPFNYEYRIVRINDKETRWVHGVGKLYFDSSGHLSEMLGTIQDITDRKFIEVERKRINTELERRVHERTMQLQQANKDLEAFAYSISHDLRAPLRHINGFMNLLGSAISPMEPKVKNYYEKISLSSKDMSVMIDELLKFSRLGRAKLNLAPVDLTEIIKKIIVQFEPDYNNRNIDWEIGKLPKVKGDAALLKIVFENLISNAIKYTSKKEHARIEIGSYEKVENDACIYVKDNGIGFDIAYKDKLFGVFQRLHKQADFEGIGIGLANVKQILKKHNGRIDVGSEVNKGTTFYISLPAE